MALGRLLKNQDWTQLFTLNLGLRGLPARVTCDEYPGLPGILGPC